MLNVKISYQDLDSYPIFPILENNFVPQIQGNVSLSVTDIPCSVSVDEVIYHPFVVDWFRNFPNPDIVPRIFFDLWFEDGSNEEIEDDETAKILYFWSSEKLAMLRDKIPQKL
jgi:hypothetical protein